jgi:glycosyltransferase involved in cell wall biosynthesis
MPTPEVKFELSVIIASHNRREILRRCLQTLANQTADPASFEVIVADDGSEDGTVAMARELRTPYRLKVLALEKGGHAAAQNAALEIAEGTACLLLDDDVIASEDLVRGHQEAHREHPMTIGIGALDQEPVAAEDWYAHTFARGWKEHYEELETREAHWTDCYGANVSFPTAILRELGGVSTDLPAAKDFDLAYRLYRAGCTPRYLPSAHGVHDDQKRSTKMLTDAYRQGGMHVELAGRYPEVATILLDWDAGAGPRELALRRAAIALRLPPPPLAWMGRFLPGNGRKMIWLHFVRRFAFWRGVRHSVHRHSWTLITHDQVDAAVATLNHDNSRRSS